MKIIEIKVEPDGTTTITTTGFTGEECREATREFEQALGVVIDDKPTAEMYSTSDATEQAKLTSGT